MVTFTLFILSGTALVSLTLAKRIEEKRKKPFFVFKAISKGDERVRTLHHEAVRLYSTGKEKSAFFVKKQLPMRAKNLLNKLLTRAAEQLERHIGDIRDSRLLKKSDGISEFFKNMSSVEKGAGEINEVYEEKGIETIRFIEAAVPAPKPVKAPRRPRAKKSPVKKRLVVTVEE